MNAQRILQALFLASTVVCLFGCAAWRGGFMEGFTSWQAQNNYFLVGTNTTSFGYRQLKYLQSYHPAIRGFIKGHGLPDFIYAYATDKGYGGFRFYYVNIDTLYVFEEKDNHPNSIFQKEERHLTDDENRIYKDLIGLPIWPVTRDTNPPERPANPPSWPDQTIAMAACLGIFVQRSVATRPLRLCHPEAVRRPEATSNCEGRTRTGKANSD
jgi:hypothetical protein